MQQKEKTNSNIKNGRIVSLICCIFAGVLIAALIIICILHHDQISVAAITAVLPEHKTEAVAVMLLLFGLKSLSIFVPCGILYAVSGIVFPKSTALLVNISGTAIMTSLPFWIARIGGARHVEKIIDRHPKMELLKNKQSENSLFFAFIIRIIGIFPCDLVSTFFGITQIPYRKYILGTMAGFLPTICIFTVMGMSVRDVSSPGFIISVCLECVVAISSYIFYRVMKKKQMNEQGGSEC